MLSYHNLAFPLVLVADSIVIRINSREPSGMGSSDHAGTSIMHSRSSFTSCTSNCGTSPASVPLDEIDEPLDDGHVVNDRISAKEPYRGIDTASFRAGSQKSFRKSL